MQLPSLNMIYDTVSTQVNRYICTHQQHETELDLHLRLGLTEVVFVRAKGSEDFSELFNGGVTFLATTFFVITLFAVCKPRFCFLEGC